MDKKPEYFVSRIIPCYTCKTVGVVKGMFKMKDCDSCNGVGEIVQRTSFDEALSYYGVRFNREAIK